MTGYVTTEGTPRFTPPGLSVAAAYARGIRDSHEPVGSDNTYGPAGLRMFEVDAAIRSWMPARYEHAHTSYYGAAHVRVMCAYWLGRKRGARS